MKYRYWVEREFLGGDRWHAVIGSEGNRSYALGWFHGLTSLIPRAAYRLVKQRMDQGALEVVEVDLGSSGVNVR